MANYSSLTRREQVLQRLLDADGTWVDGPDLANEVVGGSEGLKRLRELRSPEHGAYDIRMRQHPSQDRDIFQYRLVGGREPDVMLSVDREVPVGGAEATGTPWRNVGPNQGKPLDEIPPHVPVQATISQQMHETAQREADAIPVPEPAEVYEYRHEPTHKVTGNMKLGKTLDGKFVAVYDGPVPEPELPIAEGQTDMGVEVAPQYKYTSMPTILELGQTIPCPACHGYRRAIRERDPVTNKQMKGGKIIAYEDLSRNPNKPSETCARCNGFGVIPNA